MNIDEEIFKKLDEWVFNVETLSGKKLRVIDVIDLKEIMPEIMEVVKKFNYTPYHERDIEQLICDVDYLGNFTKGKSIYVDLMEKNTLR